MITIRILTLLGALLLWGYISAPTIKDAESIAGDSRIAFGSVEVWSGDEQETWGTKWLGHNYFYLMILPPDTDEAIPYRRDKDGTFF